MSCESIGVGIVTCNRPVFFSKCLASVLESQSTVDHIVVVNDGDEQIDTLHDNVNYIMNKNNIGAGKSKNKILKYLVKKKCEHIFVIEDDIILSSPDTLSKYIQLSKISGIKHLNYCLHGPANKDNNNKSIPKLNIDYNDIKMSLYHNITGALSYYNICVLEDIGYMDDDYKNAMEHVDHTMRAILRDYHPQFRWFADVFESDKLITDQDEDLSNSSIRKTEEWRDNFIHGVKLFHEKYDINVCSRDECVASKDEVIQFLKSVKP